MGLTQPLVVPGIRLRGGDLAREAERARRRAREPWVAGFCLFGGERSMVLDLLADLRRIADRPLFVASDMECGAGQQVLGERTFPEAAIWGAAATPEEVEHFAEMAAVDARALGVDVLFAPVLDVMSDPRNPIVGSRAFAWDPDLVISLGASYVRGALRGGALPTIKHFPGHGATTVDSHVDIPVVEDATERVLARDLAPFIRVLETTDCPAVMSAHVRYPTLDPTGTIATFSKPILDRVRASRAGARAVVFTDALCMEGARAEIGEAEAGRRALAAGCDLLLVPDDPEAVAAGLAETSAALRAGAAERIEAFLARPERTRPPLPSSPEADITLVDDVARRAVCRLFDGPPETRRVLVLDDDGVPGRGHELQRRGEELGVTVEIWTLAGPEAAAELPAWAGGGTVVVMASIGAAKGPEGVRPRTLEVVRRLEKQAVTDGGPLHVVWLGAGPVPGQPHVPGTGPAVERAVARLLLGRAS